MSLIYQTIAENVKGRNFTIDHRHPTLIIGPNGSGKTSRELATSLALGTKVGGSSVPSDLGDTASDCGRVELMIEGETGDGRSLRLTRILGARHEARVQVGDDPLVKDIKGVEAVLQAHFGTQRMQPTTLEAFCSLTDQKQAAMVAEIAGVTLEETSIRLELQGLLAGATADYDDARGQPRQARAESADVESVMEVAVHDGLSIARGSAGDQKNEWKRRKDQAEKTRLQLVDLRRADLPPGTLAEAQAKTARLQEELSAVREKLASRQQAADEYARTAARVKAAEAGIAAAVKASAAPVAAAPDTAAIRERIAEWKTKREGYEREQAAADRALNEANGKLVSLRAELVTVDRVLSEKRCPTCTLHGEALDSVLPAIQEARAGLARREVVLKLRFDQAERAAVKASDDVTAARRAEAGAREELDRAQQAGVAAAGRAAQPAADLAAARKALEEARAALAALPPVVGSEDLLAERTRLEEDLKKETSNRDALAGVEEGERLRAENEVDLNEALQKRAIWAKLEQVLANFGIDLARRAATRVCEFADRIVKPCYPDSPTRFAFRPLPEPKSDEEPGWGFGFAQHPSVANGWTPHAALSDSERMICGVALEYAKQQLGREPFKNVVLDGLEALETKRAIRLLRVLADEFYAKRLDAVTCAMRVDMKAGVPVGLDLGHLLAGSGVAVIDALHDSPATPRVTVYERGGGASYSSSQSASPEQPPSSSQSLPTAAAESGGVAVSAAAPEGALKAALQERTYIWCRHAEQRVDLQAHRERRCPCGAEEALAAERAAAEKAARDAAAKQNPSSSQSTEPAEPPTKLHGKTIVVCTGKDPAERMTASTHRASGCNCDAEERELQRRMAMAAGASASGGPVPPPDAEVVG